MPKIHRSQNMTRFVSRVMGMYVDLCKSSVKVLRDPTIRLSFYPKVKELRALLLCAVCGELVKDPCSVGGRTCEHMVCQTCVEERKAELKINFPNCDCSNWELFDKCKRLERVLQCYIRVCLFLYTRDEDDSELCEDSLPIKEKFEEILQEVANRVQEDINQHEGVVGENKRDEVGSSNASNFFLNHGQRDKDDEAHDLDGIEEASYSAQAVSMDMYDDDLYQPFPLENDFFEDKTDQNKHNLPKDSVMSSKIDLDSIHFSKLKTPNSNQPNFVKDLTSDENFKIIKTDKGVVVDQRGFKKRSTKPKKVEKKGCRCGNSVANPGQLTCCGQRCPCYSAAKSCLGCKCKGCKNPYVAEGKKLAPSAFNVTTRYVVPIKIIPEAVNSANSHSILEVKTLTDGSRPVLTNCVDSNTSYGLLVLQSN